MPETDTSACVPHLAVVGGVRIGVNLEHETGPPEAGNVNRIRPSRAPDGTSPKTNCRPQESVR